MSLLRYSVVVAIQSSIAIQCNYCATDLVFEELHIFGNAKLVVLLVILPKVSSAFEWCVCVTFSTNNSKQHKWQIRAALNHIHARVDNTASGDIACTQCTPPEYRIDVVIK